MQFVLHALGSLSVGSPSFPCQESVHKIVFDADCLLHFYIVWLLVLVLFQEVSLWVCVVYLDMLCFLQLVCLV